MENNHSKETSLAAQLKSVCDEHGKEFDIGKSAPVFHEFGNVYRSKSPDKISLIRSAVFFNAVLSRQPHNEKAMEDLKELCSHVLNLAGSKDQNLENISLKTQRMVAELRRETKKELLQLEIIPVGLPVPQLATLKAEKTKIVQKIQFRISNNFLNIMDSVSKECIYLMGNPPCQYAIVGMGSLARQEITPYSDFEHVIVLEEGVQSQPDYPQILEYFRWFTVIFQIIIINLRETIIPSVATPHLNDSSSFEGDWFFDSYTTRGISFDGMMLHACKFPLGRTQQTALKPFTTELIKPVSEMAKYLQTEEDVKNGYNLADILTRTCFVSGNQNVYKEFELLAQREQYSNFERNVIQIQSQLRKDLKSYNAIDSLHSLGVSARWNIKRVIYRSTTLFVSALGRLHSIKNCSCFEIIEALLTKQLIGEQDAKHLSFAIAVACETRLKIYMSKCGQDDYVGERKFYPTDNKIIWQLCDVMGEQSIGDYYVTARRIQKAMSGKAFQNKTSLESLPDLKFATLSLLDLRNLVLAEWQRYTQHDDINVHAVVCYSVAWSYVRSEKFEKALEIYNELEKHGESISHGLWVNCMRRKAHCLCELGRHTECLPYIKKSMSMLQSPSMKNWHDFHAWGYMQALQGDCERHLGQLNCAIKSYSSALKNISCSKSRYRSNLLAKCHYFTAQCQFVLEKFSEALEDAKTALELCEGSHIEMYLECNCNRLLGKCYLLLKQPKEALQCFLNEMKLHNHQQQYKTAASEYDLSILLDLIQEATKNLQLSKE